MNEEIKEILEALRDSIDDTGTDKVNFINWVNKIEDYITNLQEKLEVSQTNEETYRLEMEDITKCLGLDENKIFDEVKEYVTNLQEELAFIKNDYKKVVSSNDDNIVTIHRALDKLYCYGEIFDSKILQQFQKEMENILKNIYK